ncbi:MAG: hypothetical protein LBN96_06830 [Desulfovibrio sp.]|jgi:hypothetical protein|nr:hypothetical protein [Desulfovibrio sp.]
MAATSTARLRTMLQRYEQQLLSARRLARLRVRRRLAEGLDPEAPDPSITRRLFVEKTARELYETLVFTGGENPVIEDIRAEFGKLLGRSVRFVYPPGERLSIVIEGAYGLEPLSEVEQRRTRHLLWQVTRRLVERSMLCTPPPGRREEETPPEDGGR